MTKSLKEKILETYDEDLKYSFGDDQYDLNKKEVRDFLSNALDQIAQATREEIIIEIEKLKIKKQTLEKLVRAEIRSNPEIINVVLQDAIEIIKKLNEERN